MTMMLTNSTERTRFLKFMGVGLIGAVIDFGVMNLLVNLAKASFLLAGTVSFICAVLSNFTWNRYWTYPDSKSKPLINQLGQFSLVNAAGLVIRLPILHFFEPFFDRVFSSMALTSRYHTPLSHNLTLAIAVGVVMMWNFFVNRYWTYNDVVS